jgi:DNA-binding response OmpR family regulator
MAVKICLIDDDKYLLQMLTKVLEQDGFNVLPFHGGFTALVDIPEEKPDCVLTDINMSGLDGLEMIRELRKNEDCTNTLFLVMTSLEGEDWKHKAREAGAHGYLTKPVEIDKLSERIRSMLPG